jgi:hypothetical protein
MEEEAWLLIAVKVVSQSKGIYSWLPRSENIFRILLLCLLRLSHRSLVSTADWFWSLTETRCSLYNWSDSGLPDGILFRPKIAIRVNFGRLCSGNFMDIWSVLRTFDMFYCNLVYFVESWYIFTRFGILYQYKSGNPDLIVNICRREAAFDEFVTNFWLGDVQSQHGPVNPNQLYFIIFYISLSLHLYEWHVHTYIHTYIYTCVVFVRHGGVA